MPTFDIDGTTLHYETHGRGYPLLFIHGGFGGLGTGAAPQTPDWVARFSERFEVILYDRRSSGRSGFPTTRHTMAQFADDALGVLKQAGHDRAHIWGQSAGGQITLAFGLAHGAHATSLAVVDSSPCLSRDPELLAKLGERIKVLEGEGADAAYAARRESGTVGLNLFAPPPADQPPEATAERAAGADAIRKQLAAIPRAERISKYAGELRTYAAYSDFDASARLRELTMPTLIQYGEADRVFPNANWPTLIGESPHIAYRPYPGVDHGISTTRPESIDEIYDFLVAHTPT